MRNNFQFAYYGNSSYTIGAITCTILIIWKDYITKGFSVLNAVITVIDVLMEFYNLYIIFSFTKELGLGNLATIDLQQGQGGNSSNINGIEMSALSELDKVFELPLQENILKNQDDDTNSTDNEDKEGKTKTNDMILESQEHHHKYVELGD